MAFVMEAIHTVSPATKKNFDDYVSRYGEVAVPLMQESGYEILGAWECLTGKLGRDMLLVRCESMGQFEEASARLAREISAGRVASLQTPGLNIEEEVQFGYPLDYGASPESIDSRTETSRLCVCVRVDVDGANFAAALEASKSSIQNRTQQSGYELAFAYGGTSGSRGSYAEIWISQTNELVPDHTFSPHSDNETLLKLANSVSVEVIKPLPYSNIR